MAQARAERGQQWAQARPHRRGRARPWRGRRGHLLPMLTAVCLTAYKGAPACWLATVVWHTVAHGCPGCERWRFSTTLEHPARCQGRDCALHLAGGWGVFPGTSCPCSVWHGWGVAPGTSCPCSVWHGRPSGSGPARTQHLRPHRPACGFEVSLALLAAKGGPTEKGGHSGWVSRLHTCAQV